MRCFLLAEVRPPVMIVRGFKLLEMQGVRSLPPLVASIFLLMVAGCSNPRFTVPHPDDAYAAVRQELSFPAGLWEPGDEEAHFAAPVLIRARPPTHPPRLQGTGVKGHAVIEFVINENGDTTHVQVAEATNRYFAGAARTAVQLWKYRPARVNGEPVAIRAREHFRFVER